VTAFWERLRELGWIKGENLVVEERWADGHLERLPDLMTEVVRAKVDIIVTYNTASAIAAKKATNTIPIVDATMGDPVQVGLAASLARPGGNLTGLSMAYGEGIPGKFLELLQDAVPSLSSVAVIANPTYPTSPPILKALSSSAQTRRLKLQIIEVRSPESLDNAFEQARRQARAVVVLPEPMTTAHRERVTALATKYRLPAIYGLRDFVDAGGLMAYSPDLAAMFRRAADYADKILRGAKPGDLPIEQPTRYQLIVNLKTAKTLGMTIPESVLLRADEVIR
jgi:putative ABC transport system substrate-binding protein